MCILAVKKSRNTQYAFFIAFNRDEQYLKKWKDIGAHWPAYPESKGYLDITTGGSWMAFNQQVLAIVLNNDMLESEEPKAVGTRGFIALEATRKSNNAKTALDAVTKLDISEIRPFNLVLVDCKSVVYASNVNQGKMVKKIYAMSLDQDLILVNRSVPNDLTQRRIAVAMKEFENLQEPNPKVDDWASWTKFMTEESFAEMPESERTLWLNSKEWGTLNADIIAVSTKSIPAFLLHHVKSRLP